MGCLRVLPLILYVAQLSYVRLALPCCRAERPLECLRAAGIGGGGGIAGDWCALCACAGEASVRAGYIYIYRYPYLTITISLFTRYLIINVFFAKGPRHREEKQRALPSASASSHCRALR